MFIWKKSQFRLVFTGRDSDCPGGAHQRSEEQRHQVPNRGARQGGRVGGRRPGTEHHDISTIYSYGTFWGRGGGGRNEQCRNVFYVIGSSCYDILNNKHGMYPANFWYFLQFLVATFYR